MEMDNSVVSADGERVVWSRCSSAPSLCVLCRTGALIGFNSPKVFLDEGPSGDPHPGSISPPNSSGFVNECWVSTQRSETQIKNAAISMKIIFCVCSPSRRLLYFYGYKIINTLLFETDIMLHLHLKTATLRRLKLNARKDSSVSTRLERKKQPHAIWVKKKKIIFGSEFHYLAFAQFWDWWKVSSHLGFKMKLFGWWRIF